MKKIKCYAESMEYEIDGLTIDEVIDFFNYRKEVIGKICPECTEIRVKKDYESKWDESEKLLIVAYREENEEEKAIRLHHEKEIKEAQEESERITFEKLKLKFEDK